MRLSDIKRDDVVVSLSRYPGNFGNTVHNKLIKEFGLPYEYIACECTSIEDDIKIIRDRGILGCGVSMPYKIEVMGHLDQIDPIAKKVGSVNTVINRDGLLIGYNTDVKGAEWALNRSEGYIALLGNGGMSKAFQYILEARQLLYTLITRVNWGLLSQIRFDTIINATPIGMKDEPIPGLRYIPKVSIDSVVKMTPFIKSSERGVNGIDMSLQQAREQFRLYFGIEVDDKTMRSTLGEYEIN